MNKSKAIFLDRDGVINKAKIIDGLAYSPRKLEEFEFLPDVKEAVAGFKKKGYLVIVVTNQPEISRGLLKQEDLDRMHTHLKSELDVDDIMVCHHDDHHNCDCRKPKPGMLLDATRKWGIDIRNSYMVGDRWKDIEAGKRAGCRTVLIKNIASGACDPCCEISSLIDMERSLL